MDSITQRLMMGAAGAGGGEKFYVEDVFSTWLYTGNGSTQTITNTIDMSGKGGMVWCKLRGVAYNHELCDTVRGGNASIRSNTTAASTVSDIASFTSSGFNLSYTSGNVNESGQAGVSWTFRKAAKFFDVVTFSSQTPYSTNRRISHGLGVAPGFILLKAVNATSPWYVYHRSRGRSQFGTLDTGNGFNNSNNGWGSTDPTSTDFGWNEAGFGMGDSITYVAYLFAHDAGGFGDSGNDNVVSCGSYTGNGSTTGPTVTLGWEPQWLLIKRSSGFGEWVLLDAMRGIPVGSADARLFANDSLAEGIQDLISPTSTGFQLVTTNNVANGSGDTYIYIAIRRGPMKTPTDATKVFAPSVSVGGFPSFVAGFPVDFNVNGDRSGTDKMYAVSRLTGTAWMQTNTTAAEGTSSSFRWDSQTGCVSGWPPYIGWSFRRAPGFFDAVAYTGTGVARTVSHNLGVAPELMIVKARSLSNSWIIYPNNSLQYLLFTSDAVTASGIFWNSSAPTASTFSLGSHPSVNSSSNTYIAYLFASCPGVSKVGSYTGTGTTLQVNCGFTNGARFVLIKRTDSTGDWYVWDTARGIIAANDPYLLLNSTAAEVTNTDYIDPLNSGFEISSTAPAAINANGGTYIYLAIA